MRGLIFVVAVTAAACGGNGSEGDGLPNGTDGAVGGHSMMVTWTLRQSGATATCAQLGANEVWVTVKPEAGGQNTTVFQCVLSPGTLQLAAGRYAIEARLMGGSVFTEAPAQAVTIPTSAPLNFIFYN